jgi:DNA polymerase I
MHGPFREVWAVDFEFIHPEGELPRPLCLVAWELRSGQKIRLWKDRFGRNPPYSIAADSLFVSYAAASELGCHLLLGWPMPERVLDLLVEFRRAINTTPVHPVFKEPSLLKALTYYGLDGVSVGEKTYWRDVIMRGEPYTEEEQNGILDYCETDVVALARLLPVMVSRSHIDLPRALLRGRYMAAIARMQAVGVPIDRDRFDRLRERWEPIKEQLVTSLGSEYGVYDEKGSFSEKRFARYLRRKGLGWPLHEDGRMDLKDKTFKAMATIHPELEPLRQLRYSRDKLKLNELAVGQDGFNRCWLNPFGSRTSRNQPSNKKFIFGPAVWLRDFLIRPKEGWGLAYIDWISQEVGVLAGLSRDPAMMEAYNSEDFYITFGIQANLPPRCNGQDPQSRTRSTQSCGTGNAIWN